MNKKIVIIFTILSIVTVGFLTLFIINRKSNLAPTNLPENFSIIFTETNGSINAKLYIETKSFELTSENINTFSTATYNSTKDLLWVECPKDYEMKNVVSPSNNKIFTDPILKASNLELKENSQNLIQITCQK